MSVRSQVTPDSVFAAQWAARMQRAPGVRPRDVMGVTPGDVVVVVGAHPDDETLGFGASIASLSEAGIEVHAVTMSSGEAALDHVCRAADDRAADDRADDGRAVSGGAGEAPAVGSGVVDGLGPRRAQEYRRACQALGIATSRVLDLPDSHLTQHRLALRDAVSDMIAQVKPVHVLTVWWHDPHPDHRAVGQASVAAARAARCRVSGFPIWAPHWTDPVSETVGAHGMQSMSNDATAAECRRRAVQSYPSQTEPLRPDLGPILPASLVRWTTEMLVHA